VRCAPTRSKAEVKRISTPVRDLVAVVVGSEEEALVAVRVCRQRPAPGRHMSGPQQLLEVLRPPG
jgi:hypothetical protein